MDTLSKIFFPVLTCITYLVTIYDAINILRNSYKFGKLSNLRVLQVRIAIRFLPGYLKEKIQRFSDDDIDIQVKKLNRNRKSEQIIALEHLENILKFIPAESTSAQDFENISRIQRAIFRLLWRTKTDCDVVKRAVDMLCENNHLRAECGCGK